jgi:hypothetical protein
MCLGLFDQLSCQLSAESISARMAEKRCIIVLLTVDNSLVAEFLPDNNDMSLGN